MAKSSFEFDESNPNLSNAIAAIDSLIHKGYLSNLSNCEVVPASGAYTFADMSLFHVDKVVYRKGEDLNDKLVSVYSAMASHGSSVIVLIAGHDDGSDFYIGTRNEENLYEAAGVMASSLRGNFPGIKFSQCSDDQVENALYAAFPTDYRCKALATVTVVPSPREDSHSGFVQGIEKFIEGMDGLSYTAMFVADPVSDNRLADLRASYENVYSQLSILKQVQRQIGESESASIAESVSRSCTESITGSLSETIGAHEDTSFGKTRSRDRHSGTGFSLFNSSAGGSKSRTETATSGTNRSETRSCTEGSSETRGDSLSQTAQIGTSRTITLTQTDKGVEDILADIDTQIERIRNCQAYGLWEVGCYFVADYVVDAIVAANTFKALVSGDSTGVESAYVNAWSNRREQYPSIESAFGRLRYGRHPVFDIGNVGADRATTAPVSLISGRELPLIAGLPHQSVNGLTVIEAAEFGRNVIRTSGRKSRRVIDLGTVSYMGSTSQSNHVYLDTDALTAHCFVTGSTGSGKSNAVYRLLDELISERNGVTFLVVEPAKGEYRKQYGKLKGVNVFTTNPRYNEMLRINPFAFPDEVHVLEHLDRVIEIFSACWPLYAAMPALLKAAFEQAYIQHGWDLEQSICLDRGNGRYPTFRDVADILPVLLEQSAFSGETKGNYIGSLVTRVESLTNGLVGQIFSSDAIEPKRLFDENTIVDLSRVGSVETKAVIMGTLVLLLSEYRQSNADSANSPLKHVTVLEEAHNLLKRTSSEQSQEGANLQGKSVEMISNSIAEMRTYGEGFVIVDQSPSSVDISAIKNTNTKIVLSLPEKEDRESAGKSMGLDDDQTLEVVKLPVGTAIVYQSDWLEPVLVKIAKCSDDYVRDEDKINDRARQITSRGEIVTELFRQRDRAEYDRRKITSLLASSPLDKREKTSIKDSCMKATPIGKSKPGYADFCEAVAMVAHCDGLFEVLAPLLPKVSGKDPLSSEESRAYEAWEQQAIKALGSYVALTDDGLKKRTVSAVLTHIAFEKRHPCWRQYRAIKGSFIASVRRTNGSDAR
ncbi:MAG: ATP-binding protein [Eggerthellaceae bacterium]|nr:ATP-binding protein [Eggerthellaceae bacterium]